MAHKALTALLAPTEADRARLRDMERRLTGARLVSYGTLLAATALSVPWLGPVPLLGCLATMTMLGVLVRTGHRDEHPELVALAALAITELGLGGVIAATGGVDSPLLVSPGLLTVAIAARFAQRPAVVLCAISIALTCLAAVLGDPAAAAAAPDRLAFLAASMAGVAAFCAAIANSEQRFRVDSSTDPLTGLLTRRALDARFADLARRAAATGGDVAVVLMDIDVFKQINDDFGHLRGDAVLRDVAGSLLGGLQDGEPAFRLGGDEFLVMLGGPPEIDGAIAGRRLREAIAASRPGGLDVSVTVGTASAAATSARLDELMAVADDRMYAAKRRSVPAASSSLRRVS